MVRAGPAGLEAATVAAKRGHQVVLFEEKGKLAASSTWPSNSSEEYAQTIRYYDSMLKNMVLRSI